MIVFTAVKASKFVVSEFFRPATVIFAPSAIRKFNSVATVMTFSAPKTMLDSLMDALMNCGFVVPKARTLPSKGMTRNEARSVAFECGSGHALTPATVLPQIMISASAKMLSLVVGAVKLFWMSNFISNS